MKKYFVILQVILGVISFPAEIYSQLDMQNYIGKSRTEVTNAIGAPVHVDASNRSMVMIFYKSANSSKTFVADENGVYQAEATQCFESEKSCKAALDMYISDMINKGFVVDTTSVTDFQATKPGVFCEFHFGLNSYSNKYEISVKAHRRES